MGWSLMLQLAVFPCLAVIGGLVGMIYRGLSAKVAGSMTRELCRERHEDLSQTMKRIDTKLADLCNGGRIGNIEKDVATHAVRLHQLEGD